MNRSEYIQQHIGGALNERRTTPIGAMQDFRAFFNPSWQAKVKKAFDALRKEATSIAPKNQTEGARFTLYRRFIRRLQTIPEFRANNISLTFMDDAPPTDSPELLVLTTGYQYSDNGLIQLVIDPRVPFEVLTNPKIDLYHEFEAMLYHEWIHRHQFEPIQGTGRINLLRQKIRGQRGTLFGFNNKYFNQHVEIDAYAHQMAHHVIHGHNNEWVNTFWYVGSQSSMSTIHKLLNTFYRLLKGQVSDERITAVRKHMDTLIQELRNN